MTKRRQGKITNEFQNTNFGDSRLSKRLINLVEKINISPNDCINAAIKDWATTKAAYRFFDNKKSDYIKILSPHIRQTESRMNKQKIVYSIQDTSFLNFNKKKKTTGLGSIGKYPNMDDPIQGIIMHMTLGVSEKGLPLGIQKLNLWTRPEKGYGDEERIKESKKWLTGFEAARKLYNGDKTKMILLADREADYFDLISECTQYKKDFVIRSKHNRNIKNQPFSMVGSLDLVEKSFSLVIRNVTGKNKKKRTAFCNLKYSKVKIEVPGKKQSQYPFGLELNVVEVKEINPPEKEEALEWRLITSLPVNNFSDANKIIDHYRMRWKVESYFKILKSGCKIEDCRLMTAERLKRYIAINTVVAWRLFWSVEINRSAPEMNAICAITELEFKTLWLITNKFKIKKGEVSKKPPSQINWTVREAIRAIAQQGGFNGRKGDGEPGMISIWRGWHCLQDMMEIAEIFI